MSYPPDDYITANFGKFSPERGVVFDIGAGNGTWTRTVLSLLPQLTVHAFELCPDRHRSLRDLLADPLRNTQSWANQARLSAGASDGNGQDSLEFASNVRPQRHAATNLGLEDAPVSWTLDDYCRRRRIPRIHFLRISADSNAVEVLRGARHLLKRGEIDFIQFEIGPNCCMSAGAFNEICELLVQRRYQISQVTDSGLLRCECLPESESTEPQQRFLAVNERFLSGLDPELEGFAVDALCRRHGISPRGVIQIGAHYGEEVEALLRMGEIPVLLIEADPYLASDLKVRFAANPSIVVAAVAVSDENGTVALNLSSSDACNSILPFKRHEEIYPDIRMVAAIEVPCRTLDQLLSELHLDPRDFDLLVLDIQGAELRALRGAKGLLSGIQAILTEVNYEELYAGGALIGSLDDELESAGFERTATASQSSTSWGDAFYVRTQALQERSQETAECICNSSA